MDVAYQSPADSLSSAGLAIIQHLSMITSLWVTLCGAWRPLTSADAGSYRQGHMVNYHPDTMLPDGGLQKLHCADEETVNWQEQTWTKAVMTRNEAKSVICLVLWP